MLPGHDQAADVQPDPLYKFDDGLVFDLPGYGKAKVDCGQWIYMGHQVSDEQLHIIRRRKSCHRKECPVCWPDWQKREALSILDRIQEYHKLTGRMPVHYVISPPQSVEYNTKKQFRALRKKAYEIGKQRGIKGGVMIFHERAARYSDSESYTKAHCSNGPHFHIIGDGWLSEKVKEFFLADGWIVKNLRIRKMKSVYGTAVYILDHAAIAHGYPAISQSRVSELASVTWFGTMSYNKLHVPQFTGPDTIFCPICHQEISKEEWYIVDWMGLKDPPNEDHFTGKWARNAWIVRRDSSVSY